MLKSTYKPPVGLPPLPQGWTQHKAPNGMLAERARKKVFGWIANIFIGNPYYYNDVSKQSTYVRPVQQPQQVLHPLPVTFGGALGQRHNTYPTEDPTHVNGGARTTGPPGNHPSGRKELYQGRGVTEGHAHQPRPQPKDRPKKKDHIPGCPPWLLVQTKLGRRFVYNSERKESFWKFPPDVMKAVIEYDRLEREKRMRKERGEISDAEDAEQVATEPKIARAGDGVPTAATAPAPDIPTPTQKIVDSDGEEYEEVEVTDDEEDNHLSKRQKTEDGDVRQQLLEFNEDDIAYQLAAMGEDYGLDPGEYGNGDDEELEEGAEGLALTKEDSKSLFKDMLSDNQISPYTTWDKVIEAGHIIEDDRYTVLANMKARKDVWDEWSRDTVQSLKEQREMTEKKDPRIPYFAFLQSHASPKLYWPEFRRKYKKEPEIHSTKLTDKDREKWYREYISRLKLPESTLKRDLVQLLKCTPLHDLNKSTTIETLPATLLTDMRYISLRSSIHDPLIEAHIASLSAAPTDSPTEEADIKALNERERREQALTARQKQVSEEKRRQTGALQHSRGMLRDGEEELKRAMMVGKQGLLGHVN